jgi:hypothetical protein
MIFLEYYKRNKKILYYIYKIPVDITAVLLLKFSGNTSAEMWPTFHQKLFCTLVKILS